MVCESECWDEAEIDLLSLLWVNGDNGDLDFFSWELASPDSGGVGDDGVDREPACAAEIKLDNQ